MADWTSFEVSLSQAFNLGHTPKRVPTFLELPQAELYPVTRAPFMAVRRWCGAGSAQKAKGLLRGIVKNRQIA